MRRLVLKKEPLDTLRGGRIGDGVAYVPEPDGVAVELETSASAGLDEAGGCARLSVYGLVANQRTSN